MRLLAEITRGLAESIRETLPRTDDEAGVFLSGLTWAFVLHWAILIAVTYLHCSARGGC